MLVIRVVVVHGPNGRHGCCDKTDMEDDKMVRVHHSSRAHVLSAVAVMLGLVASAGAGEVRYAVHWSTVWATAMVRSPVPANAIRRVVQAAPQLSHQTLRQMIVVSAGGSRIRVILSNNFGKLPLRIYAASIGRLLVGGKNGQIAAATLRVLRFGGRRDVIVPPGAERYSDPVHLQIHAGNVVAVSLYVAGVATPSTWQPDARWNNLISPPGDYTDKPVMPVERETGATMWLAGLQVETRRPLPVLVALGDSITNGYRSNVDAAESYPQQLARRLHDIYPTCRLAIIDMGIDGNEMSERDGDYGPGESMVRRFKRDVLDQSGVRYVILLGGINDIGETTMALRAEGKRLDARSAQIIAARVIAAQRKLVEQAHAANVRIFGATLLPFKGTQGAYSRAGDQARREVNDWIREHAPFNAVIDFAAALRDPSDHARLRPRLDSGDHIHPNDRGYGVMAKSVRPSLVGCKR